MPRSVFVGLVTALEVPWHWNRPPGPIQMEQGWADQDGRTQAMGLHQIGHHRRFVGHRPAIGLLRNQGAVHGQCQLLLGKAARHRAGRQPVAARAAGADHHRRHAGLV